MRAILILLVTFVIFSSESSAGHVRATSAPVMISSIYANEWGSPFVRFTSQINAACNNGNGLYLYNIELTQPSAELRKNKMGILLSAKMAANRVVLDYFYDAALSPGWDACYIHGIEIVD